MGFLHETRHRRNGQLDNTEKAGLTSGIVLHMTNELEHKHFRRLSCLIIVFVGLVVYSNTIHSSFHFDDYRSIVENPLIRDLSNIPQFFQENKYTSPSRGIVTTTFALNYYLSGLSVVSYHLVNIAIHLLNGILVYLMAATILNQCIPRDHSTFRADVLALFVALLFVTSPAQTHTVNYVVQRNDELSSTFYLLSFIFFAKAVSQNLVITPFYVLSIVFFLGGLWCKETAYTAFTMMFLYYLSFVSRGRHGWSRGLKLALPYVILAVVSIHIAVPVHQAPPLGLQLPIGKEVIPHVERPWQYPLTQTGVILEYIKLLAWPLPDRLNVDYDVALADTFWEFSTAASTIIIIGLLCTALVLLLLNRVRLLAFSVLWFLVILMPTSSIFPMGEGELMVCYRLYLPGLAFYLLLVAGIHKLFCRLGEKKWVEPRRLNLAELIVFTGIVLFYSACAYEHNKVWKTEVSLWEDAVKKSPNKMRPHYNLGKAYERNGMLDQAKTEYFRCMEMLEGTPNSERRLSLGPYYHAGLSLASIYSSHGEYAEAIAMYKKCLTTVYWEADGHNNLGLTYYKAGYLEDAEREFRLAIELNPKLSVAHENLGALYEVKGMPEEAVAAFMEAIKTDPKNTNAHIRLGQLWWNYKKSAETALTHLNAALNADIDGETSKKVLLAIDAINEQVLHPPEPITKKAPQ